MAINKQKKPRMLISIVTSDQVAADAFGCTLLNLQPADLLYLTKAQAAGVGTADYQSLKPLMATM